VKPKQQRLILVGFAVLAIVGSGVLALSALQSKAAYFYSPSDIRKEHVEIGKAIRLGGMVAENSIRRQPDGVTIHFVVEDGADTLPVVFKGITPDLFKEKSGVIAEGSLSKSGEFVATNLLAKHDEKYMPPELAGKMHKTGKVAK
jgi:cytochrome c-type biogenesis protein CcmE